MTIANMIRVSIFGSLPGGEKWSVNPVYGLAGGTDVQVSELEAAATAIVAIAPPTALRLTMGFASTIDGVRLEARLWDGTLVAVVEKAYTTPLAGTGTQPKTYQASIVLSLQTLIPGGRGRGRLYWPATGMTVNSTSLRIDSTELTALATGAATWLKGIEDAIDTAVGAVTVLSVWSRADVTGHPVSTIRVGNVLDTQRRRRDSLSEGYSVASY